MECRIYLRDIITELALGENYYKHGLLLTDIYQTNVLAFDELQCDRNILHFLGSKRGLFVVSRYFLVRENL